MEESLRRHADEQAAVELRAYVVVPLPAAARPTAHAALAGLRRSRLGGARADARRCRRTGGRCARARRTSTRCAPSSRRSGCRCSQLDGEQVLRLLWARLNPTSADAAGAPAERGGRGARRARRRARPRAGARGPRWRCASGSRGSSLDFTRARHVRRGRARPRAGHLRAHAPRSRPRWAGCMGAMLTRQPYTLSVFVHALDRRRERQQIKLGYRRLFAINRGAEQRGRVPDFDRYAQEREYQELLGEMAGHDRANVFEVSDLPGDPRAAARTPTSPRSARRSTTASSSSSRRLTARSTAASSASAELWAEHAAARPRRRAPRAQVRDRATSATRSRWSAPPAARRPASRSRSPTPAAPSSA